MASTILHYTIASIIVEKMNIENKERFILGALLPDASSHEDKSYFAAHFMRTCGEIKGFNWHEFKEKYSEKIKKDSLYQGYMCHIIMDAVWFQKIADKYIRIYPQPIRQEYYYKAYKDYWKLNYILVRNYELVKSNIYASDISITEIHEALISKVIQGLKEQYNISEKYEVNDMEIIPYEAIENYIKESVDLCIKELSCIETKDCSINPETLYVGK